MTKPKKKPYNVMKEFAIDEIASVDRPAQGVGARMAMMKRRDAPEVNLQVVNVNDTVDGLDFAKAAAFMRVLKANEQAFRELIDKDGDMTKKVALLDPMDGHSHTLMLDHGNGELNSGDTSWNDDHTHPWLFGANGELIVGAANGHTHRVGFLSKQVVADVLDETKYTSEQMSARSDGTRTADQSADHVGTEENMTDKTEKLDPQIQEQLDAMKAENVRLAKVAALTDAEKAYFKSLSEAEQGSFLDAEDKSSIVEKANAEDPIVAVVEGIEVRASQDPLGVIAAMEKRDKKKSKKLDFLESDNKKKDLEKRAADLSHLPGTPEVHMEMLKSIDAIEDPAVRKAALETLTAKAASAADDFKTKGVDGENLEKSEGEQALDKMAKAEMAKDSELTYEAAYTKALLTDEGQAHYNKSLEG